MTRPAAPRAKLAKELGLFSVFAIATGTTLSAGFFLLPGLAAHEVGSALVLAYLIAAVFLLPAALSVAELATAMPRAGGAYYFLDRSLGPLVGTIGGFATWLVLVLKTAFALIGMGAYVRLFVPTVRMIPFAVVLAVSFGLINLVGARSAGSAQVALVVGLLVLLFVFMVDGLPAVDLGHFEGLLDPGADSILAAAGMVYVSYVGVTHVASISEEVADPERNLPRGLLLAIGTIVLVYGLGTFVIVGVVPAAMLDGDLTPVATAARLLSGGTGAALVTGAALLAFSAVANAGILSASRYPLAISRDQLLPPFFGRLGRRGTPVVGIGVTVGMIVCCLVALDPTNLAKLASTFQLLVLGLLSLAVIVMRESRIESYDPGFRSPFYPWTQVAGILAPAWLISEMGWVSVLPAMLFLALAAAWYRYYAHGHVEREGAVYHVFERLGRRRFEGLDRELRDILGEKGLRDEDPYEELVARADVLDLPGALSLPEITHAVVTHLAPRVHLSAEDLERRFAGADAVPLIARGVALPHVRVPGLGQPELVVVRAAGHGADRSARALFYLASGEANPAQHLRLLAEIARRVEDERFLGVWLAAADGHELKEILLREERFLTLVVEDATATAPMAGRALRELRFPGCLVALIRRDGQAIVPRGDTVLRRLDRLTLIGDPGAIGALRARYGDARLPPPAGQAPGAR